jgi:hypothetical protein
MLVKYTYDEKTEENLKRFKSVLFEYEALLEKKIKERGLHDNEARVCFLEDAGRKSILNQLVKITSVAIPVSVEFAGV